MKTTKQTVLKKKAKQLCCILLAAILCIGMTVPVMAASSKYNAAVSSYKKYMRGKRGSYKIVDVDGNGIPELLMHNSSAGINEVRTYNPKTRKNVRVGSIGYGKGYNLPIKYSRSCHTVMVCNANTGGSEYYIYKIKGTKATRVVRAERFNGKFKSGYAINGRKVGYSTYNRTINRYMKNAKTVRSSGYYIPFSFNC